jgi:hypothetical protein
VGLPGDPPSLRETLTVLTLKLYTPKRLDRRRTDGYGRPKRQSAPHRPPDPSGKSRLQLAADWLCRMIPPGVEWQAGDLLRLAQRDGHAKVTLARARWRVGVATRRGRGKVCPPWIWSRPRQRFAR